MPVDRSERVPAAPPRSLFTLPRCHAATLPTGTHKPSSDVHPVSFEGALSELCSNAYGVVAAEVWLQGDSGLLERPRGGYVRDPPYQHPKGSVAAASLAKFGSGRSLAAALARRPISTRTPLTSRPTNHRRRPTNAPPLTRHQRTPSASSGSLLARAWQVVSGMSHWHDHPTR